MPGRSLATRYVWADLVRNPRRTLSTTAGVALGVGLSCAVLFFVDGLSASMTQRAVAPLPVDMQQVLVAPVAGDLRLHQELDPAGTPQPGQTVRVHLELANEGAVVANEVILRSVPAPGLDYVADSARVDGDTIAPGPDNPFLLAASGAGHNFGALPAGAVLSVDYDVEVAASTDLGVGSVRSTASSRESLTPVEADASGPTDVAQLADAIAAVDGVDFAEPLAFADLEPGALSAGSRGQTGPVRVFGCLPRAQDSVSRLAHSRFLEQRLHQRLVHANRAGRDAAAGIWHTGHLEEALDRLQRVGDAALIDGLAEHGDRAIFEAAALR